MCDKVPELAQKRGSNHFWAKPKFTEFFNAGVPLINPWLPRHHGVLLTVVNKWTLSELCSEEKSPGLMRSLLILHLLVSISMSLKVFSFERTHQFSNPSSSLSFASLDSETSEDLPSRFYWKIKRGFCKAKFKAPYMYVYIQKCIHTYIHICRFVLCWSHKQGAWDQRGVFHIYGIKDQPWLTIRFCIMSWVRHGVYLVT